MTLFRRQVGRVFVISLCLVAVALPIRAFGDAKNESQARLLNDVKYLADDERQGRGIGTDGLNQAADFIRAEFEKAGLNVSLIENDAFQKFTMTSSSELGSPNSLHFVGPDGKSLELKYDVDFRTCGFGSSGSFDADVVFCGYAIDDEDAKYNDLDGIDLKGKVAVIMRRVPGQSKADSPFHAAHGGISRHATLLSKVRVAVDHGAAAIMFVNDPYTVRKNVELDEKLVDKAKDSVVGEAEVLSAADSGDAEIFSQAKKNLAAAVEKLKAARDEAKKPDDDPLMILSYGGKTKGDSVPTFHITHEVFNRLLNSSLKKTLTQLEADIDSDFKPRSTLLEGWTAKGATTITRNRAEVKNVIGVLDGVGPLADETIVIGAHYDHVGMGGEGSLLPGSHDVHNGADDNASGTVSLIELARRFVARREKFPRRLMFIAFTGEERGLIGSARYVKEPLYPLEQTIAMFNMDMVGRLTDDKLTVFGTGTAPRWKGMIEELGKQQGFRMTLKPGGFGPSDQSSFYAKKIPVLHFFTGTHSDYHRPSDDWDKINVSGMNRIVDMIEEVIVKTANSPQRPTYVAIKNREHVGRGGSRPYFGSIPDFSSEVKGYTISGASPGSPADRGGLKGGDSIIQLGEKKISSLEDFDFALRGFSPGDDVDVIVLRNGEKVKLKVTLVKPR